MGGKKDLESIYKRYLNDVYRYLLHLSPNPQTAEDLTQETFYRAYLYLDSYRGEKVKPWLLRVARNSLIDWYRKEKHRISIDPAAVDQIADKARAEPEKIYLTSEEIREWLQFVTSLPLRQRQVILLCDYYGFAYQEAAELLGISAVNLKVSLFRGRKKIKEMLAMEGKI